MSESSNVDLAGTNEKSNEIMHGWLNMKLIRANRQLLLDFETDCAIKTISISYFLTGNQRSTSYFGVLLIPM